MSLFSKNGGFGILEYVLIIILAFLILYTLLTLLWPALVLFYETTLQGLTN